MQEEEAPKVEEEADVWAPHVSEYWERNNRGILGHTKIRGSASGSKASKTYKMARFKETKNCNDRFQNS